MNAKLTALLILILTFGGVAYWQKTRGPVATIVPKSEQQWFDVGEVTAMDSSFLVERWKGFASGAAATRPANMKETLSGEFASDSPALLMLMDDKNFERLRLGYPPLPVATFQPGEVRAEVPGGKTWLVFFQNPARQQPDAFPTTGLQLGLALLKRLHDEDAPPARVTAHLTVSYSAFLNPEDAAKLRAKFRAAMARHRKTQADLPAPLQMKYPQMATDGAK